MGVMVGKRILLLLFTLLMWSASWPAILAQESAPAAGFVSLFNGKDLSGWIVEPDNGTFFVKDGAIVCNAKTKPPNAAFSKKEYENFILELDYRISEKGNSGIFIHAPRWGRESRVGFELQIHGLGDAPNKHNTGAIYDVVAPMKKVPWRVNDWNHVRVYFDWPIAKVWWNDELVQNINFAENDGLRYRLRRGFIGLQNHGAFVEFKNICIKELPSKEKWTSLLNGKDLSAWTQVGDANWHVEDNAIVATEGSGFLLSESEFDDFELQAYVERDQQAFGGIYYRWKSLLDRGYEAEYYNHADALKFTQNGKEVPPNSLPPFTQPYLLMQIISHARESIVRINGVTVSERINHNRIRAGHIAIQFHPQDDVLRIRDVKIKK